MPAMAEEDLSPSRGVASLQKSVNIEEVKLKGDATATGRSCQKHHRLLKQQDRQGIALTSFIFIGRSVVPLGGW